MKFLFDEKIDRRNTGSMKWDVNENELPMWVADMDFQTAPEITASMMERAGQGVFGYTIVTDEWYEAYKNWWKTGISLKSEESGWFLYRCRTRYIQYCP